MTGAPCHGCHPIEPPLLTITHNPQSPVDVGRRLRRRAALTRAAFGRAGFKGRFVATLAIPRARKSLDDAFLTAVVKNHDGMFRKSRRP